jgi:hypothetical protein
MANLGMQPLALNKLSTRKQPNTKLLLLSRAELVGCLFRPAPYLVMIDSVNQLPNTEACGRMTYAAYLVIISSLSYCCAVYIIMYVYMWLSYWGGGC